MYVNISQILPQLWNIPPPKKKLENTEEHSRFLFENIWPNLRVNSQYTPIHPPSRGMTRALPPISSHQLPYAPFPCSRATLCFRRSGVSGAYIHTQQPPREQPRLFSPYKVQASFAALRRICMHMYTCTCSLSLSKRIVQFVRVLEVLRRYISRVTRCIKSHALILNYQTIFF